MIWRYPHFRKPPNVFQHGSWTWVCLECKHVGIKHVDQVECVIGIQFQLITPLLILDDLYPPIRCTVIKTEQQVIITH